MSPGKYMVHNLDVFVLLVSNGDGPVAHSINVYFTTRNIIVRKIISHLVEEIFIWLSLSKFFE
jgi:hypothetical protein